MKRSKSYFGHNTFSFRLIHMKPTPKGSLINSLSSDMVTNVALLKLCTLPSARTSCYHHHHRHHHHHHHLLLLLLLLLLLQLLLHTTTNDSNTSVIICIKGN